MVAAITLTFSITVPAYCTTFTCAVADKDWNISEAVITTSTAIPTKGTVITISNLPKTWPDSTVTKVEITEHGKTKVLSDEITEYKNKKGNLVIDDNQTITYVVKNKNVDSISIIFAINEISLDQPSLDMAEICNDGSVWRPIEDSIEADEAAAMTAAEQKLKVAEKKETSDNSDALAQYYAALEKQKSKNATASNSTLSNEELLAIYYAKLESKKK